MAEQMTESINKRVVCLYRVSTIGQVEKDDIPMQKQYCREFSKRQPGWEIVKEFSEKGVSGFKISAKDRDAIQEIQRMALQGEFDILLVFMFDRLDQLLFYLRLCFAEDVLDDALASLRIIACGVPAFPATILAFADVTFISVSPSL